MNMALSARISRVVEASGLALPERTVSALSGWIELVQRWNRKIDLTAARDEDELVDLMLADALLLASHVPAAARVVDVGTGAGAPGLPLAIVRSDLDVTLSEPLQKRMAFLRTVLGTLWAVDPRGGLLSHGPPQITRERGEELARRGLSFDVAISRAALPPAEWLALAAQLAREGELWLLLARDDPPARAGWTVSDDIRYRWPLTGAERRAVRFVPQQGARETGHRSNDVVRVGDGERSQGGSP